MDSVHIVSHPRHQLCLPAQAARMMYDMADGDGWPSAGDREHSPTDVITDEDISLLWQHDMAAAVDCFGM
jgi:hypothetical protein